MKLGSEGRRPAAGPRRGGWWAGVLLLLPGLVACRGPEVPAPTGDRQGNLLRWIADDPRQRFDPRQEVTPAQLGEARRVDLGHMVLPARLAQLGSPLAWPLPEGAAGELRFSLGLAPGARDPVRVRILDQRDGGGAERVLLKKILDPAKTPEEAPQETSARSADDDPGRWHRLKLDLPAAPAGRLLFETRAEGGGSGHSAAVFWGDPTIHLPTPDTPTPDTATARRRAVAGAHPITNLVLVSVDTWRADRLSLYGYGRDTTPWLERWAKRRAVVFEQAVAAAPWTLPSHVSMLSGVGPLGHRVHHDIGGQRGMGLPELLAERLRRRGWSTLAVTGGAYLHPDFGFDRGFDTYVYWADRGKSKHELRSGVDRSLAWLGERPTGQPFFLFLHTYATHDPYRAHQPHFDRWAPPALEWPPGANIALDSRVREPPEHRKISHFVRRHRGERQSLDLPADQPLLDALYDSGLAHVDQQLGRLLRGLDELGLRSSTLVVLTSDHGEALGDRGGDAGHETLYDHTLRVPLIFAFPDRRAAGQRITAAVRSIDLVPTVLEALGLRDEAGDGKIEGRSLLGYIGAAAEGTSPLAEATGPAWSYAAAPNHGLALRWENRFKAILDTDAWRRGGRRRIELYDLEKDPTEEYDLLAGPDADPELAETWYRRFARAWDEREGLWLRLQNPGTGQLVGELEGEMIRPVATKSLDLDCPCLEWVDSGHARFRLGPGDAFTLYFEKVFGQGLKVRGELNDAEGRHRLSGVLDTGDPSALVWNGKTFVRLDSQALGDSPGLALGWRGEPWHDDDSAAANGALRRQLEALGYL